MDKIFDIITLINSFVMILLALFVYKIRISLLKLQSIPNVDVWVNLNTEGNILLTLKNHGPIPIKKIMVKKRYFFRFWKNPIKGNFVLSEGMLDKGEHISKEIDCKLVKSKRITTDRKYYWPLRISYIEFSGDEKDILVN